MSAQARPWDLCVGIVPRQHAELFGDELCAAFPQLTVTLRFHLDDQGVELWVKPGLTHRELHRWARRFQRRWEEVTVTPKT